MSAADRTAIYQCSVSYRPAFLPWLGFAKLMCFELATTAAARLDAHASQAEPFLLSGCCSRTRARGQPADRQLACCSQSCVLAGFPHASAQGCGHTLVFVRQQPVRPTVFHIYIYMYMYIHASVRMSVLRESSLLEDLRAREGGAQPMAMHFWGWIA